MSGIGLKIEQQQLYCEAVTGLVGREPYREPIYCLKSAELLCTDCGCPLCVGCNLPCYTCAEPLHVDCREAHAKLAGHSVDVPLCESCSHTEKEHEDRYGCEHDRGDRQVQEVGAVAMGPCGCKAFIPETTYSGQLIASLLDVVDAVERRVGL